MKTAISVPADVFDLSEKLAKKLKISRSAVFALGVKKLAKEHDEEEIVARINRVCDGADTSLDPFWKKAQARVLRKND